MLAHAVLWNDRSSVASQEPLRRLNLLEMVATTVHVAGASDAAAAAERAASLLNSLHAMLAASVPDATPPGALPLENESP